MTALVEIRDLSVRLGDETVLEGVDLTVAPGEIVTIVGPNGSGKTTLLRSVLGRVPVASGVLRRKPGLKIGYVPQKLALDATLPMTVRRFLDLPDRVSDAQANAALARTGSEALVARQMAALSGGQAQRVLLARALLGTPDLLLLDEATQGLDQPGSAEFYRTIEEVRRATGVAVMMVSHELHVVMAASDRVICLNGHVCCHGTPEHVASAPEYRAMFGSGTHGALALYRHEHDHAHDHTHDHDHSEHEH